MPGKVVFDLAPKGKAALEAMAKARRERVTSQLQQAISQEQKAKQRTNILNRMESIHGNWKDYQVPDKNRIESIEQEAATLLETTKQTQAKQPKCQITLENYEQEFSAYKAQIENLTAQNSSLYKAANSYTQIKPAIVAISADAEKINRTIAKYEPEPEAAAQVNKLKTTLAQLKQIQMHLETFNNDQLSRLEDVKARLAENSKTLEALKKPTHEFTIIKHSSQTEKTLLYPDPELPTILDRQTTHAQLEEKCVKCGTKRKSTPVTIG